MCSLSRFEALDAGSIVDAIPEEATIVLLGECTHGTEEFYVQRAEITKRLIETRGFDTVLFEADHPFMEHVNDYVHHRRSAPFPAAVRFPEWMWQNAAFLEFAEWCKGKSKPPLLFGMDCYSLFESKAALTAFLERHDPPFAAEVKDRLGYLDRFETGSAYGDALVNGSLKHVAGHLREVLERIQSKLQWDCRYDCTPLEKLSAEQNCEVRAISRLRASSAA